MLDFTSVLYLGMGHPSRALRPWPSLTTGAPAALVQPPGSAEVAAELAALVGAERALLGPSTLHLCWDLFGILARRELCVFVDAGAYAIARSCVERAAARRRPVHRFAHYDPDALADALHAHAGASRLPVILADGFCPGCDRIAPLPAYLELARAHGALVILDDTQALGIHGAGVGPDAPYGRGGGGTPSRTGAAGPELLVVSSLAKAFGVPIALVAGSARWIARIEAESAMRVHCSPPSAAVIHAAARALALNRREGDARRRSLARRVRRFQHAVEAVGLRTRSSLFPMQWLRLGASVAPVPVHDRLLRRGVRTVVLAPRCGRQALVFVLTARHRPAEIDAAARVLGAAVNLVAR